MNKLIVCDLHGDWQGFFNLLRKAGAIDWDGPDIPFDAPPGDDPSYKDITRNPDWEIIQIGDAAHMGPWIDPHRPQRYQHRNDLICLRAVEHLCDTILVGNHELYFTHGLQAGHFHGRAIEYQLEPGVLSTISRIQGRADPLPITPSTLTHNRFTAATTTVVAGEPWLLTHAGLHPSFARDVIKVSELLYGPINDLGPSQGLARASYIHNRIAQVLNQDLIDRMLNRVDYNPWIDDIGPIPGGPDPWGSIFWLRPDEVANEYWKGSIYPRINQIVGHTPNRDYHPEYDPVSNTWYIDADCAAGIVSYDDQPWEPFYLRPMAHNACY